MIGIHTVAAVVVHDVAGRILLFDRTRQPFGWTVPAGHVEDGEDPRLAAARELWEETGISISRTELTALGDDVIQGDLCRRGASTHRWFTYGVRLPSPFPVTLCDEGSAFRWVFPVEAAALPLTRATRYVLDRYAF